MTFAQLTLDVSKRDKKEGGGKGEFIKVGTMTVHTPILRDIIPFITSEPQTKDGKEVTDEDGILLYVSEEANWVQGAILAAVKAQARNKLAPGTANLKEGAKIATDWAELIAEGTRDGAGLKLAREFKDSFNDWVAKQNLSEAAANNLIAIVGNRTALSLQGDVVKAKVKARLEQYAEAMDESTVEKFMRPLTASMESTAPGNNTDF